VPVQVWFCIGTFSNPFKGWVKTVQGSKVNTAIKIMMGSGIPKNNNSEERMMDLLVNQVDESGWYWAAGICTSR
jgi:hypothetical protein